MPINSNIVIMLRTVINDLDSETYTDARLEQTLAVAAVFVNKDLDGTYVINVTVPDISPDPYVTMDDTFVNLLVMKAACLIDQGTYRSKAILSGLEAKCGPAVLKTMGHLDGFKELLANGPCGAYQAMLTDYKLGSGNLCHIILSPFVSDNFDIRDFHSSSDYRDFIK